MRHSVVSVFLFKHNMELVQITAISKMSEYVSISDLITTIRPATDYDGAVISSTTRVTKPDVVPASGATVLHQAAEMIAATLVMSACIAATIFGNVLVVLSVFTYRT